MNITCDNGDEIIQSLRYLTAKQRELSVQLLALKNQSNALQYILQQNQIFGRMWCGY